MSATMFTPDALSSKIPILSPTPLRRTSSLRLDSNHNFSRAPNLLSKDLHFQRATASQSQRSSNLLLKRGHSFMEKGDARAPKIRELKTEPRQAGALDRAGTPDSPHRNRSLSLSLSTTRLSAPSRSSNQTSPRTPPATPDSRHSSHHQSGAFPESWDTESVSSSISLASCEHASVARNGTTFSGRSMKYVVHCNQHAGATGEDYLTPTQRAHRQVKLLKTLLQQAQKDLEQRDSDIVKLTKEVVELRLYKAALSSPEEKSNSSDTITVRENTEQQISPEDLVDGVAVVNHLGETNSYADSGHYEDYANSSVHSKDSVHLSEDFNQSPFKPKFPAETAEKSCSTQLDPNYASEYSRLIEEYERRIQELVKTHEEDCHQLKQKHNDKIEELLQRLSEINARYWQLVPDLELARERITELETQLEEVGKKLEEQEVKHKENYLKLFEQEQARKSQRENPVLDMVPSSCSRISVPELLHQLQVTQTELENIKDLEYTSSSNNMQPLLSAKEAVSLWVLGARKAMYRQLVEVKGSKNKIDPEITLQFLKSAIYYFLTDKENNQGHLRAIQSILGFTPAEITNIEKARSNQ